jgi:PKD repeat protein
VPVSTSRGTWTHAFGDLGVYQIRQTVCDSKGQCAQEAKTVTVVNRSPVADFDWSPKPVWESNTIHLRNKSSDPDRDSLTYSWSMKHVDSNTTTNSSTFEPSISMAKAGTYQITLTVCDTYASCNSKTQNIAVWPVQITGRVLHTDLWEENRLRFNNAAAAAGRPTRPSWYFFPGEKFILAANTVGDNIVKVDAYLLNASKQSTGFWANLPGAPDTWNGSLWHETFLKLKTQDMYFRFVLTTDTGFQKEDIVQIRIEDQDYWRQHTIR